MNRSSKILLSLLGLLIFLSVSATFYKTVILQDFEMTGLSVEFSAPNNSSIWFIYENTEYEIELETTEYNQILEAVAKKLDMRVSELDKEFVRQFKTTYDEALQEEPSNETAAYDETQELEKSETNPSDNLNEAQQL